MKYNGKTRQEIVNRIWEKTNEGVGKFDLKYLQLFQVERVLQAAEEVFAEMEPKHNFEIGDRVNHKSFNAQGVGIVCGISKSGKTIVVDFPDLKTKGHFSPEDLINLEVVQYGEG